jgi:hypothetical protein
MHTPFGTGSIMSKLKQASIAGSLASLALLMACSGGGSLGNGGTTGGSGGGGGTGGGGTGGGGGTTTPTFRIGNGTGAAFQAGQILLSSASLAAGGSATLTVTVVDQNGTLSTDNLSVNFASPCASLNTASITPATVMTSTGTATATYVAQGCSGADVITATTTAGGQTLTATGTITVQAAAVGSIQFISATPINVGLKGTGRAETSTVVFRVVDSSGGPRQGATVNFTLDTTVGGLSISPASATSGIDGTVQTVVSSGTAPTPVRVTATIPAAGTSPARSTQSNALTVTTGIPDSDSFSIAVSCSNVEAFNVDGVVVPVTVRLSDRFNNPVPDGTAVQFSANGGQIGGSCTTPLSSASSGDGTCRVNWTSADPRPSYVSGTDTIRGRVKILATVIGEESFTDTNGNGFFDTGETFMDLGEPFRDDNENGAYNNGEFFLDFNTNSTRDGGSGTFRGITCTGTGSSSTCGISTLGIGATTTIVMSTSAANITGPGPITTTRSQSVPLAFTVQDLNGNSMPSGTTIAVTSSAAIGTIDTPSSFTIPCTANRGGFNFTVFLITPTSGMGTVSGQVTVTVTSPGGLITRLFTPVTVN